MYKKWGIVLTVFPFTDLSGEKVRPAVILSAEAKDDDVIVAFISSQLIYRDKVDILIKKSSPEFGKTGLKVDSIIRLRKMAAINKKIILGQLGSAGPSIQKVVSKNLKIIFDLN
ncbi:MAG TPA: type II toxin-antitoxin system PemK/MazF family toxin [Candidatus Paceibacterota bacterium]